MRKVPCWSVPNPSGRGRVQQLPCWSLLGDWLVDLLRLRPGHIPTNARVVVLRVLRCGQIRKRDAIERLRFLRHWQVLVGDGERLLGLRPGDLRLRDGLLFLSELPRGNLHSSAFGSSLLAVCRGNLSRDPGLVELYRLLCGPLLYPWVLGVRRELSRGFVSDDRVGELHRLRRGDFSSKRWSVELRGLSVWLLFTVSNNGCDVRGAPRGGIRHTFFEQVSHVIGCHRNAE